MGEEEPFLKAEDGAPFTPVFRHVRLQYIINDLASARILERDNILPPGKGGDLDSDLCFTFTCDSFSSHFYFLCKTPHTRLADLRVQEPVVCHATDGARQ